MVRTLVAVCLLLLPMTASAATSAEAVSVSGVVTDASGAAVPGARVALRNAAGVVVASTTSREDGRYELTAEPGEYALIVERAGFAKATEAVHLKHGPTEVGVTLTPGGVATEVSVTAEAGQVADIERLAQRVNVIPEMELEQRTYSGLAQIAQEEVGVAQQKTSPTIGAVLVRGLNDVAVYVDGVRWTQATQRGGINTFFNLNDPATLQAVEVLRGPGSGQYGSDSLAGTVHLVTKYPTTGSEHPVLSGRWSTHYASADHAFGSSANLSYGTRRFGINGDLTATRHSRMRPGGGHDTHAAVTRFLGLPSTVFGERLPDTAFTQYAGSVHAAATLSDDQQLSFRYQRGQQDGGRRYDQMLGGDGNLIADLRNLMLDFGYVKYQKQKLGVFDSGSFAASYNAQREERVNQGGQGNPLGAVTSDKERTTALGFNFFVDKLIGGHALLFGADVYRDEVKAPSYSRDPASGAVMVVRPRVPNGARFLSYGFYAQDGFELVPERLRVSGALRYSVASYRAREADAPVVAGAPLFPDDSLRVGDWSGRVGLVATLVEGVSVATQYSRGFRAPNITALGSVGLVGVGYQVAASALRGQPAFVGTTADETAVSTGRAVAPLISENSNNYDVTLSVSRGAVSASLGGFFMQYSNTISRQALILPPGAVGMMLGSQPIVQQNANGAVFVPVSTTPVLVQVNFGKSNIRGLESELKLRMSTHWSAAANYTYVHAEDEDGLPPNTEGGTLPPQTMNLKLRFDPATRYWVEAYGVLAGVQDRISSLGLSDRRTGAMRTRSQIQNFFRRGATVRGLVSAGADGVFGNADDILIPTGETLAQVQDRVLGGGVNSAPLFTRLPGYGWFGLRGGVRVTERTSLLVDFANIGDKNYRNASWGMPGAGRSVNVRWTVEF